MDRRTWTRLALTGLVAALAVPGALRAATADDQTLVPLITLTVVVTDSQSGQPISQARLTLTFRTRKENQFSRPKTLSYSAKTDPQGRYQLPYIPTGTVTLMVTDEHHQTFGKQFDVDKDHATLEVKLKPPQPLI
jgi:hypothetical protein